MDIITKVWVVLTFIVAVIWVFIGIGSFVMDTLETKKKVDYLMKKDKKNVP